MKVKLGSGRPAGRKNFVYESVAEVPPACRKCGGTELITVGKPPIIRDIMGIHEGQEYNRVVWTDKVCVNCNQRLRIITYQKIIARNNKTS